MAGGTVAGVRCLPWINVAVPSATLVKLEAHLQGEVTLRSHVGQLSGPVASGRLAACFDWGVLWPWNWSADVFLKVVLGLWSGLLPFADEMTPATLTGLNGAALAVVVVMAWASIVFRPYVHLIDVITTVSSRVAVALTVGACLLVDTEKALALGGEWG